MLEIVATLGSLVAQEKNQVNKPKRAAKSCMDPHVVTVYRHNIVVHRSIQGECQT